ncbi:MAG: N-acetylmuramoyl-L-alanine amidase (T7 lysozyme) [Candidatus Scalindua rubra]|uniref:N-acetylmuramoyl-L-alanine amidase (T7 lysozyme) n=1 Tax=Candidatus Scalindua rubra TaxID=1872076 RepID=A0A1E3XB94_9BACT|nr:MAG: N-acetylmuramoyl-L-alanine amidase (T7 lysozyme) [Candidatus Scalindua rubra]
MIKYKWSYLMIFFFVLPIMYGCSSTRVSTLPPIPKKYIKPEPEIIIPSTILSELNKFKVRPWKYIVIHHSASYSGNASSIDKYHRNERGWTNGLGYHFLIGNGNGSRDGQIEVGNRWNQQIDGAHAGNDEYNKYGVGICLIGNFENSRPTESQISSLLYLINYLQKRCNIPKGNIITHKNFRKTVCPGKYFPYYDVMARLR